MASFTPHGDRVRAHVFAAGRRASKVFQTKRLARDWALKKEAELEALSPGGRQSLQMAVEKYLKTVSPTKRNALDWERRRFDVMLAFFGSTKALDAIDSDQVGKWRDDRLKTVSGSTVQREANLLRHLFTLACDEWRWIERNPFKGVRLPEENQPRHQIWRWQAIKRVLRAGHASGGKIGECVDAFHISLRTGMRLSEALAAPGAFSAARRVVTLARTKASGRREIPIVRQAVRLLRRKAFDVGPNEASALFSRLVARLMIEELTFHDARATGLTLLARKYDVMTLARISGHKDINLLFSTYYRESADSIAARL